MKLSFTTLSCPDWSWDHIVEQAALMGFHGLEIRGVEGEMFLPRARPFVRDQIPHTMQQLKRNNLEICCFDTSCRFHEAASFDQAIEEGMATIDLAQSMHVPYIRVFGDAIPDAEHKEAIITQVARGLDLLASYAEGKGVTVLIETHGDFSASDALLAALHQTKSQALGVLWDVNHPYKAFQEPMEVTYERLKPYIKHIHLKDSVGTGKEAQLCLVGEGDLPIKECIAMLKQAGYDGWLSLEWEKKWHPKLEEPEIALPVYMNYMRDLL